LEAANRPASDRRRPSGATTDPFDWITVRILNEGHDGAAGMHRTRLVQGPAALGFDVLGGLVDIVHLNGEMAIPGVQSVLFDAPVIRQFDHALFRLLPSPKEGEILTIKAVAESLKVTDRTLDRLAGAKKIPAFKVGGTWRFSHMDIDA
jgi:excisionase family DNA binding protein